MSIKSINEPDGPGRTTQLTPASINEPPQLPELPDQMPTPAISSLDPASCAIGDPDFTLYVSGEKFFAGSVIHFADHDEPTTLNEDGTLSTGVKPSLWASPVTVQCTIKNGGVESNAVGFEFTDPAARSAGRRSHGAATHSTQSGKRR